MPDQINWSLQEEGLDDLERWLDRARLTSADMHHPLEQSKDHVQNMIAEEFLTDGERSGGWVSLEHDYDTWKILRGQYEMLRLDKAFLHGEPGTPRKAEMFGVLLSDTSWEVTHEDAIFGPDSTRAAWHQEGAPDRRKGGPLPARPVLFFTEGDYGEIEEYFENWMQEEVILEPAHPGANVGRSTIGTFIPLD